MEAYSCPWHKHSAIYIYGSQVSILRIHRLTDRLNDYYNPWRCGVPRVNMYPTHVVHTHSAVENNFMVTI